MLTILLPTASDLSIDCLGKAGFMITGSGNTIKLIYAIQEITLMMISNMSGIWSNGRNRTFRGSDPDYYNDKVLVNGNTSRIIAGNGNCMITGDADALRYCKTFGDGQ